MSNDPITKENLLSALENGRLYKNKRKSPSWYVEMIKEHHVNFQLTADDENKIRQHGSYLGKKGLDNLIAAVRNNYRPNVAQQPTSTPSLINQSMVNSPGGIQAGGDVTINQGPQSRKLTPEQRGRLISALQQSVSKGQVRVTHVMGDAESTDFADELERVLEATGWKVNEIGESAFIPVPKGLVVVVHSPETAPKHAFALVDAFTAAGFAIQRDVYPGLPSSTVELVVGRNPK